MQNMAPQPCTNGTIHLIGIPTTHKVTVLKQVKESLHKGLKILDYQNRVDVVVIEAQKSFVIPDLGIGGSAIGKSCIEIKIDFSRKDVKEIIAVEVPATIYHELAHLVRESNVGLGDTLQDALISEGVACSVEKAMLPKRKIPYIQKIPNENKLWVRTKKNLHKKKYNYAEWFFGSGALPNWTGYRLGYLIVEKYMRANTVKLNELVRLESIDIVQRSAMHNEYIDYRGTTN